MGFNRSQHLCWSFKLSILMFIYCWSDCFNREISFYRHILSNFHTQYVRMLWSCNTRGKMLADFLRYFFWQNSVKKKFPVTQVRENLTKKSLGTISKLEQSILARLHEVLARSSQDEIFFLTELQLGAWWYLPAWRIFSHYHNIPTIDQQQKWRSPPAFFLACIRNVCFACSLETLVKMT